MTATTVHCGDSFTLRGHIPASGYPVPRIGLAPLGIYFASNAPRK